jgi:hypothetical protein
MSDLASLLEQLLEEQRTTNDLLRSGIITHSLERGIFMQLKRSQRTGKWEGIPVEDLPEEEQILFDVVQSELFE